MTTTDGSRETRRAMTVAEKARLQSTFTDETSEPPQQGINVPADRNPNEFVNITHPDIAGTPAVTYAAFVQVYQAKGFSIVEDPAHVITEEELRFREANPPVGTNSTAVQPEGVTTQPVVDNPTTPT